MGTKTDPGRDTRGQTALRDAEATLPLGFESIRCEAAGIYCAVLGIPQLVAAGRAKVCCRHYLDTEDQ